jgi:hypothetical protein
MRDAKGRRQSAKVPKCKITRLSRLSPHTLAVWPVRTPARSWLCTGRLSCARTRRKQASRMYPRYTGGEKRKGRGGEGTNEGTEGEEPARVSE